MNTKVQNKKDCPYCDNTGVTNTLIDFDTIEYRYCECEVGQAKYEWDNDPEREGRITSSGVER